MLRHAFDNRKNGGCLVETITLILQVIILLCMGVFVLIVKHYLPSYMKKKGENLATKEDIAEITKKTEEVQKDFKEQLELFTSDVKFKYEYYFRQYSELYCKLYVTVIQSEYVRFFINKMNGTIITFDDEPFVEISPTEKTTKTIHFENEKVTVESKLDVIETDISQLNKKAIIDCIIANGNLASQELLKLAVSYRFAHDYSSEIEDNQVTNELTQTANEEDSRLIRDLVCCIIKEYNSLRKSLNISFDEEELRTGIPHC